jgi:prolyl 4-hydroxylase
MAGATSNDLQPPNFITNPFNNSHTCQDTMIGYIAAIFPLYIFVYLPVSNILFGTSQRPAANIAQFNSSFIATNEPLSCPSHNYNTHILSLEPLVIYVEGFLSPDESTHLLEIR